MSDAPQPRKIPDEVWKALAWEGIRPKNPMGRKCVCPVCAKDRKKSGRPSLTVYTFDKRYQAVAKCHHCNFLKIVPWPKK